MGRVSERDGVGKDSPVWDREAGEEAADPPSSCERLEAVCASTSGWAGRAERTDVRIGRARVRLKEISETKPLVTLNWLLQHISVCVHVEKYLYTYAFFKNTS